MHRLRSILLLSLGLALLPYASSAQPALETKQRFVSAVIEFLEAVPGLYGDEGARLAQSVEAMDAGLRRWDGSLDAYQRAMNLQIPDATASVAAALRVQLAAVFLERGRVDAALREFDAGRGLAPERSDIHLFRALAYESGRRGAEAADAVESAWKLDPQDPVKAYLYLRHLKGDVNPATKAQALQTLAQAVDRAAASRRVEQAAPFIHVRLLDEPSDRAPTFAPVRYRGAFEALAAGDYEEAVRRFRLAMTRDPLVIDAALGSDPVRRAIARFREGNIGAAIELLEQGSQRAPESSEVHRILATAYWFDEQDPKAIGHFREAIRLNPDDERSRTMLADLFSDAKQLVQAEETLRSAVTAMPGSGLSHWRLGRLHQLLQQDVDARAEFERALVLSPVAGAARLHSAIARWYRRETNFDAAIRAAGQWVEFDLNDAAAHKELGETLHSAGRDEEALVELLVAAWLNPTDPETSQLIGQIYLAADKYDEAVAALRRAVDGRPRHAESRYTFAVALTRAGKDEEGAQQLEMARQLQAEALAASRRAYELNLIKIDAALKAREGNHQAAAQMWGRVAALEPQVASNYVNLGEALARIGRHEEAAAAFTAAFRLSPDPGLHRSLAREYEAAGRTEDSQREHALYRQAKQEELRRLGTNR